MECLLLMKKEALSLIPLKLNLNETLISLVLNQGPLDIETFLNIYLYNQNFGYYNNPSNTVVGASADFMTSAEISQLFGEIIACYCLNHWYQTGKPTPVQLLELGPGRGTLLNDMLRVFKNVPDFFNNLNIVCLEACPFLKAYQEHILTLKPITHIHTIAALPLCATQYFIANEYFDALPIAQYSIDPQTQQTIKQTLDYDKSTQQFLFSPFHYPLIETCQQAIDVMKTIQSCFTHTSLGVFIDYGYGDGIAYDSTLQAVQNHQKVDILSLLQHRYAKADISHQVNFKELCEPLQPIPYTLQTQRDFLLNNGITQRLEVLARSNPWAAKELALGVSRLISTTLMGDAFKVLTCAYT